MIVEISLEHKGQQQEYLTQLCTGGPFSGMFESTSSTSSLTSKLSSEVIIWFGIGVNRHYEKVSICSEVVRKEVQQKLLIPCYIVKLLISTSVHI